MASIVLPNQLFPEPLEGGQRYIVEHPKHFSRLKFHKQKLVLHRASMKAYWEKHGGEYVEYDEDLEQVFEHESRIEMYDPVDHEIRSQMKELGEKHDTEVEFLETPGFMVSMERNRTYFDRNSYYHLEYYKTVRREKDILLKDSGGPVGGKWSFDPENREKMPENHEPPEIPEFSSRYVEEAKQYVQENFSENPGKIDGFFWPVTREQALENLDDFLENRMENFGKYQDAIDSDLRFGYHSLLSSSINIGLLTPEEVVQKTLDKHQIEKFPMNSLEGFIRQITGWREFIRAMYELKPEMRKENFWNASNPMPEEFYTSETGLPPVDVSVQNARENAYCHHIERLMVLGNVMLLLEIDPDEVYDWFMEMFIDSYEWVMVPNIYGMSQYAWPEMMTKPYISSSNYIRKMSNYGGGDWEDHWDGLYWNFIDEHEEKITDIQRMSFMVSTLGRMGEKTLEEHHNNAKEFKQKLGVYE